LEMADAATVERVTGAPVGFAGPTGIVGLRIVADNAVRVMHNFITGANQADTHLVHVNVNRDFTPSDFADVRVAVAGDACPKCHNGNLEEVRGIEVGHIFKLGDKYSGAMGANYTDAAGATQPILMGSYGIGISRLLSALVETSHDKDGIIWHPSVAPFQAVVVVANVRDEAATKAGQEIHDALQNAGVSVLLDDRDERAGVKFKDADLVGYPVRVVVGKGLANGVVEVRARRDAATSREVSVAEVVRAAQNLLQG
jgi:prolyl-tRNA synthetase